MNYTSSPTMKFGLGAVLVAVLFACHENDQYAELHEAEPSVSNGIFTFSQVADGSVRVRPTDSSSSFTRADMIEANMQLGSSAITASKTPVEIGTVEYTKFEYQLDGNRDCRWTKGMFLPSCTATQAQNSQTAGQEQGPKVIQMASAMDGMTCENHSGFPNPVWQKKFRVALLGDSPDLDKVTEARYTVSSGYKKTFVGANRLDNFDAGATFMTPSTSLLIDAAKIITTDGKEFTIPAARLIWTDNDLSKPAGKPCEM